VHQVGKKDYHYKKDVTCKLGLCVYDFFMCLTMVVHMTVFTVFRIRCKYRFCMLVVMFYMLLHNTKSGTSGTLRMSGWLRCSWHETEELQGGMASNDTMSMKIYQFHKKIIRGRDIK